MVPYLNQERKLDLPVTSSPCPAAVEVLMDDREPASIMLPAFQSCGGVAVQIRRLPVADYSVNGELLVERKTLPDLVQSIIDGRLFHQARRLADTERPAMLVLEGNLQELNTDMRWEAIQGALITVSLFFGVPALWTRDPHDTARVLAYSARQQKAAHTDSLVRHGRRPRRKAALQSYILQGLPGVGPKLARRLIERFGTVEAVIAADAISLIDVAGLGERTAQRIREALR